VIVAHVIGLPVEESVLQFAPAGTATVALFFLAGRATLERLLSRMRRP
jgi:hypothetical protein